MNNGAEKMAIFTLLSEEGGDLFICEFELVISECGCFEKLWKGFVPISQNLVSFGVINM